MKRLILVAALIAVFPVQGASAETITYSYDALGRLVSSSVTGGPSGGATTGIGYDAAGNRTSYSISGRTAPNAATVSAPGARAELAMRRVPANKEEAPVV